MRFHAVLLGALIWFAAAPSAHPVSAEEGPQPSAPAPTANDEALYAKTIATMRDLPEPPYLTFVTNVSVQGDQSVALLSNHGTVVFRIWMGKSKEKGQPSGSWPTSYRASDDLGSVANTPQRHLLSHTPLFNPTWTGAFDWLRYGINGRPPIPKSSSQASPESNEQLKTIGIVRVLGPSAYHISAANPALCPSGQPGRHLHLTAQGDIWKHPLTDVTIDLASTRFCSMRFHSPDNGVGGVAFAELHFGAVNGYWITITVDDDFRGFGQFGIGGRRASFHITYDEMRFPEKLDDAIFNLPDGLQGSPGST